MSSLYQAAASGDRNALEGYLLQITPMVTRNCKRLKGQIAVAADSADAAQLVLLKVYEALSSGISATEDDFEAWVRKQCRSICRKLTKAATAKKRDYRLTVSRDATAAQGETAIDVVDYRSPEQAPELEATGLVGELLASVTREDDRQILAGIAEGLSIAEMAYRVGVEVKWVYTRLKHLKARAAKLQAQAAC